MEPFRRLLPDAAADLTAADLAAAVPGPPPPDRPFLFVNFIATADGRATIAGRTGPIANRADYELFHALRTAPTPSWWAPRPCASRATARWTRPPCSSPAAPACPRRSGC